MTVVSVVIPAYNRAHIVGRAIESAIAQSRQPFEIIVVDDCSTDRTREVLAGWQRLDSRVRPLLRTTNGGPAGARNTGVEVATGNLIAFLDSDDVWLPNHLADCVELLEADPSLDLVFADVRRRHNSGAIVHPAFLSESKRIHQYLSPHPAGRNWFQFRVPEVEVLFRDYVIPMQTTLIRREIAQAFRFDEALRGPEDYQLALRLALSGKKFGFVNRVACECLLHDANLVGEGTDARMCGEDIKLWNGLLRDHEIGREGRSHAHRHLSRLWHDKGHNHLRRGDTRQAIRAYALSLWHRPSSKAMRGLANVASGMLTGNRCHKETL